jgi:hypothetical protein
MAMAETFVHCVKRGRGIPFNLRFNSCEEVPVLLILKLLAFEHPTCPLAHVMLFKSKLIDHS